MNKCKEHYEDLSSEVWDLWTNFVEATQEDEQKMMLRIAIEASKLGVIVADAEDGFKHDADSDEFENTSYGIYEELSSIAYEVTGWVEKLSEYPQADKRMDLWRQIASRFGDIETSMTQDYDDSKKCIEYRSRIEKYFSRVFHIEVEDR